jgi:hypothetical protein
MNVGKERCRVVGRSKTKKKENGKADYFLLSFENK